MVIGPKEFGDPRCVLRFIEALFIKADAERLNVDIAELRRHEMTQFVDEDDQTQTDRDFARGKKIVEPIGIVAQEIDGGGESVRQEEVGRPQAEPDEGIAGVCAQVQVC